MASAALTLWLAAANLDDLEKLGDIGQAFGAVSALLAAIALFGVLSSLRLQRLQTQVAAMQGMRNTRMQLLLFALDHPRYLSLWGYSVTAGVDEARAVAYISMIFAYLKMAFVVGGLAEQELRAATPAIFTNQQTRAFWAAARSTYLADDSSLASVRFAEVINDAYEAAGAHDDFLPSDVTSPSRARDPAAGRTGGLQRGAAITSAFCSGVLVGVLVYKWAGGSRRR